MTRLTFVIICETMNHVRFLMDTAWNKVSRSLVVPTDHLVKCFEFTGGHIIHDEFQLIFTTPQNWEKLRGIELVDFRYYPETYFGDIELYWFLQSRMRGLALTPNVEKSARRKEIENGIEMLCTTKYGS